MRRFKPDKGAKNAPGSLVLPIDELSDELVLHAIATGAVKALEVLYDRYHRLLYSLAYRMVTDHQIAEDLLQDAFLAVWSRANTYSMKSGTVRSWLLAIMHHRAIDYLRAARRGVSYANIPLDELEHSESELTAPDAWDEAWQSIQGTQVREALMKLSAEQRMVIELAYFQGWTHTEIAAGCQLPLGTVKARMRLGLMHLKQILEQMGIREL